MPPSIKAQKVACDWLNKMDRAVRVNVLPNDENTLAELIDAAIAAEREACAKIADAYVEKAAKIADAYVEKAWAANDIAADIRAGT